MKYISFTTPASKLSSRRTLRLIIALTLLPLLLVSCIKTVEPRGYTFEDVDVSQLKPEANTKDDVVKLLGTPSSKSTFGRDTWYYISAKVERVAFLSGKTIEQQVMAVEFNEAGTIVSIHQYTLKDAMQVQYAKEATPAEGSDTSAVSQIFGNVGRFNPSGASPAPRTQPRAPLP